MAEEAVGGLAAKVDRQANLEGEEGQLDRRNVLGEVEMEYCYQAAGALEAYWRSDLSDPRSEAVLTGDDFALGNTIVTVTGIGTLSGSGSGSGSVTVIVIVIDRDFDFDSNSSQIVDICASKLAG